MLKPEPLPSDAISLQAGKLRRRLFCCVWNTGSDTEELFATIPISAEASATASRAPIFRKPRKYYSDNDRR